MNFKTFYLTEMPFVSQGFGNVARSKEYWNSSIYKQFEKSKLIKKIDDNYSLYENVKSKNPILFYKEDDKLFGICQLTNKYIKELSISYPTITWLAVSPDKQQMGISKRFHEIVMDLYGGFITDVFLTTESLNFYKKFSKNYNCYILKDETFEESPILSNTDDDTRYIITKDKI